MNPVDAMSPRRLLDTFASQRGRRAGHGHPMILDKEGRPVSVETMARLVAEDVFGSATARCLGATPCEGAAGTTYRLDFEHGGRRRILYVKLPTKSVERHALFAQRLRDEYRFTCEIAQAFPETATLKTVTPAAFVEAVQGFATWATPGVSLEDRLRQRCRRFGGPLDEARVWCVQAAAWLDAFHRLPCPYSVAAARAWIDTYLDDRLVTLANHCGSGVSERLASDLKSSLMRMVDNELAHRPVVRCHNDYSPHNMLLDGFSLCVLDYSFAGPGLSSFDVACFWHKLDDIRESPTHDPRRVTALQEAFIGASATPDLASPAVTLGIARLVLSKMVTRLRKPTWRPYLRFAQRRRYRNWLRWLESGFDPRHLIT